MLEVCRYYKPEDSAVTSEYNQWIKCNVILRVVVSHCLTSFSTWSQCIHCLTLQAVHATSRHYN